LNKGKPPIMKQRILKTLTEIPSYPNIKNESRLKEEERIIQFTESFLEPNGSVMDFGCGTSYYTGSNASGLDLDREMLKKADLENRMLAHYSYVPFKNESFNIVVMCHSLEHTNNPDKPLKQAYRILVDKGKIIVSVPNLRSVKGIWKLFYNQTILSVAPDHLTVFTPKMLKQLFQRCGFKPIKESGDIVYFPLMKRLRLMKLGYWLSKHFPSLSNVFILVGEKTTKKEAEAQNELSNVYVVVAQK